MRIVPYIQIFKFLKRLQEDAKIKDVSGIRPPRSTDILVLQNDEFHLYHWTSETIKTYVLKIWYVLNDWKISNDGEVFLEHYSHWCWKIELLYMNYPFLWGLFGGLIGAVLFEVIKFLVKQL